MDIYFDRIKPLFDQSGENDADLERNIGIPPKKINQWNARYTKSYQKYIPKIASYFHVSTDYLLGNTDDPTPAGQKEKPTLNFESGLTDPLDIQLMKELPGLTPDQKELLLAQIRVLKDRK